MSKLYLCCLAGGARTLTFLLVVCMLYADVAHVPLLGPLVERWAPSPAYAAAGGYSIYRNNADVTALTTTPVAIRWDTIVSESGDATRQPGNSAIDLALGGKYLVLYNVWSDTGGSTGDNRRALDTYLSVAGVTQAYGFASGYVRDSSGEDVNAYNAGAAIVEASAGDDLVVNAVRTDSNTGAGLNVRAGTNGLQVVKLNDTYDYLRLQQITGVTDISSNASFTDVPFNQADEVDTGSFGFTASSTASAITLKGPVGKKFLVTANIKLQAVSGATRQNYELRLVRDGSEIAGSRTAGYLRGSEDTIDTTLNYVGVIEKQSGADEVVRLQVRRESVGSATTAIVGGETAVAMVALPTGIPSVGLTYGGGGQTLAVSQTPFTWDTQAFIDAGTFGHSTSSNSSRVAIDVAGDYLFFSTAYTERSSDGDRNVPRIDWRLDGSTVSTYGGHGSFNRGDQGTNDAYTSGSSGGVLLAGVTAGQYLELLHSDETGDTPNATFLANRIALQGISVAALTNNDVTVAAVTEQAATVAPNVTNFNTGLQFSITEETSARNVTNITIQESGSVDAQSDLDNIALFYDLDTTAPYNCVGESYSGSEAQFGVTDTDGFTGANGVSIFTDSVSISTTQTFCGYVVLDVGVGTFDGETINLSIADPSNDVSVSGGGVVIPNTAVLDQSLTTVVDSEVTQSAYHWRNDDGSETGASSATGGVANQPLVNADTATAQRLRLGVYSAGTGTTTKQFRLEYAEKAGTCEAATGWDVVGNAGAAWDQFDSGNLTNGADTSNIPIGNGGVSDPVATFVIGNGGVRDTTATSGLITLGLQVDDTIGEYGSISVSNGTPSTISLNATYENPVVAVSVRYSRSTETQRTPRVVAKSSTTFDVLIDNYNSTLTGTTQIDYVVIEAGEHAVPTGSGTLQLYAGTTSIPATQTYGAGIPTAPAGTTVTYPTAFGSQPLVFATVASNNDSDWVFASAYDGTNVANPPTLSQAVVFMNENFESDGHGAAETIDLIAFEPGVGTNNGTDFVWQQTGSSITSTPSTIAYTSAYSSTPGVILAYHPTNGGADGGFTLVDTDTAPTNTGVTIAVDEDGTGADRGHAGTETASLFSAATANSILAGSEILPTFAELEYSIIPTGNAVEGVGYCFRVSDSGTPLRNYDVYPEATLNADVTVGTLGTQSASVEADTTAVALGGTFRITSNSGTHIVSSLSLTERGSVDARRLRNPQLAVESDTSNPYNCVSESYDGTETTVAGTAFTAANGTSTFASLGTVSTSSALCAYLVFDVASSTSNGADIDVVINNPNTDVVAGAASVGPGVLVDIAGVTTVNAPAITQTGYHWRADNGTETTASSTTGGVENTPIALVARGETQRLRLAVSNEGAADSNGEAFRLEYGVKSTTCENVGSWERVGNGVAFALATTSQLVAGDDTTAAPDAGNITDPNTTFLTPNGGQRDTTDETGSLALTTTEFAELEYAIVATEQSGFDTAYCFRVTSAGVPLAAYTTYPELSTRPQQDFLVQRGEGFIVGTSQTFTAGVDYTAPASTSAAFVRITNSHHTGAGTPAGSTDPPDDTTAYIEVTDLTTSFDIVRPSTAAGDTYVAWEIVEYIGLPGADNELVVRDVGTVTYAGSELFATGTPVTTVVDDAAVAVFITGQLNPATATGDSNTSLSLSRWDSASGAPVFERGDADGIAAGVSYAVVEFTGVNWAVQRVEHTYTAAGVFETQSIAPVTAITQAFLHTQKLSGDELSFLDEHGHEVYLSGMGTISFELEAGATNPSEQRSVAWVIENMQTGDGALRNWRSNGRIASGGTDNQTFTLPIGLPLGETVNTSNASIFINNQSTGGGPAHPRAHLGATIASSTDYTLYKSDEGQNQDYRVSVIEWPVAELSVRQNYYRLYVDNDAVQPTDPWPAGPSDLGENESITDLDEPLGIGERVRIRLSLTVNNASLVPNAKSFTLQYGRRVSSCSAVSSWSDVGASGSGDIWRGYDGTPVDGTPVASSSLLLSVSDQPGTYEEANDSTLNPVLVDIGEDVEYDWVVENNGAIQKSSYCFRVVEAGGALLDGYDFYPTVRTSGYTPVITNWRWYTDVANVTPTTAAAAERVAASNVDVDDTLKLRVAITEVEGAAGENVRFHLEYSEYSDFRDGGTVLTATSSCTGGQLWCYADGGGVDNAFIPSTVLSDVDSCVAGVGDGCGVHNEQPGLTSTFDHAAGGTAEHEFVLEHDAALVNQVYYFRMVDVTNGSPLIASGTLPSIVTAGSDFTFSVTGLPSGTTTEGVVIDETAAPDAVRFSDLPLNVAREVGHRVQVDTNASGGYRVFLRASQPLQSAAGATIPAIAADNATPGSWASLCPSSVSCVGYHAGDDTLSGDAARFALDDTYAALPVGTLDEIMYNSLPHSDSQDIIYRTQITLLQPAGSYTSSLEYIVVPQF